MSGLSDYELLRVIYRCIDFERLVGEHGEGVRARADELFKRLASQLAPLGAPGASGVYVMNVDGASRRNPGPAAVGIVIRDNHGNLIDQIGECIGVATNNEAEYRGMLRAAQRAVELGAKQVHFCVDSELLAKQMRGEYRVKARPLVALHIELRRLLSNIPKWNIQHVPREENAEADALANAALDRAV